MGYDLFILIGVLIYTITIKGMGICIKSISARESSYSIKKDTS